MDEVNKKTPPSGLAVKVGSAFRNRCKFPLQLTAQHLTISQPGSRTKLSSDGEPCPTLLLKEHRGCQKWTSWSNPIKSSLRDCGLRLDCPTDCIGNEDIETSQPIDTLLHRVFAVGQYTLILGRRVS